MIKDEKWLARVFKEFPRQEYADAMTDESWEHFISIMNPQPLSYIFANYIRIPEKYFYQLWKIYIKRWSQRYVAKEYVQHFGWDKMLEKLTPKQICQTVDTFNTYKIDPPGTIDVATLKKRLFRKILHKDEWAVKLIQQVEEIYQHPKIVRIASDMLYCVYYSGPGKWANEEFDRDTCPITEKEHAALGKLVRANRHERAAWIPITLKVLEKGPCKEPLLAVMEKFGFKAELEKYLKGEANGKPDDKVSEQPVLQSSHA